MNPFDAIVVITDFSAVANNAVRRAALLAREHDARLSILHVIDRKGDDRAGDRVARTIDPTLRATQARASLERIADELSRAFDVKADLVLQFGDSLDVLVSESSRASLVVLGQRAGGSIKELVFRTRIDRLLDACARPVLVVKQEAKGRYRRVLTALDFTPASDAAALVAAALAPSAALHLMHVFRPERDDALRRTEVRADLLRKMGARQDAGVIAQMRRRAATMGFDSRKLRFEVGRGSSASTILSQRRTQEADLVAVGRQQRSKWLDALLGSVSRRVLARSQGDVLVVPSLPGSPVVSRAAAARRLPSGRDDRAAFAPPGWTIEADPANTRPPAWPPAQSARPDNPLGTSPP